ncbi:uncharacterized protein LOC117801567 [Ailuropoda melanoleuca]|uniref:uncharacterized protein LOC117801567 n=1 Tax=Ailuropoda melanoleuca TaxID=9646 RepID=UPI00149481C4|nr:uncharacterized protein LOC117801567 [Ailuropoda melanoleuca]
MQIGLCVPSSTPVSKSPSPERCSCSKTLDSSLPPLDGGGSAEWSGSYEDVQSPKSFIFSPAIGQEPHLIKAGSFTVPVPEGTSRASLVYLKYFPWLLLGEVEVEVKGTASRVWKNIFQVTSGKFPGSERDPGALRHPGPCIFLSEGVRGLNLFTVLQALLGPRLLPLPLAGILALPRMRPEPGDGITERGACVFLPRSYSAVINSLLKFQSRQGFNPV